MVMKPQGETPSGDGAGNVGDHVANHGSPHVRGDGDSSGDGSGGLGDMLPIMLRKGQ